MWNQIASGFESFVCWWCTINKNVDRMNNIHYNVQALGNKTEFEFRAIHEQLKATCLIAFQSRIAVDMLLADRSVCSIFGYQCCSFIPNNTAADESVTRAIEGLGSLNQKENERPLQGRHFSVGWFLWHVGKYRQLAASIIMSIAIFAAILTLCGCCCILCIRVLCTRFSTTAIAQMEEKMSNLYALLTRQDSDVDDTMMMLLVETMSLHTNLTIPSRSLICSLTQGIMLGASKCTYLKKKSFEVITGWC